MAATFEVNSNYIPDDISFSILSKLSVKSLNRFSCVCKSWTLLFENPNFMNMFSNNIVSKSHSLYDENDVYLILNQFAASGSHRDWYLLSGDSFQSKVKLNFPSLFSIAQNGRGALDYTLGSAINGILCIHDYDHNAVLWNPATEEIKVIPSNLGEFSDEVLMCSTFLGFGYDYVRDDYKVIRHVCYFARNKYVQDDEYDDEIWEVYSLKNNSWRELGFKMPAPNLISGPHREVYFNGMCHWLADTSGETYVVSFNLANEVFIVTPLPLKYMPTCFDLSLLVLNGSFTIVSSHTETKSFEISILGEYGVKESLVRLFAVGPLSFIIEYPIGAKKNGDIFFTDIYDDGLVCFNLTTGMIKEINIKEEIWLCKMIIYKKNFQPIGGMNN